MSLHSSFSFGRVVCLLFFASLALTTLDAAAAAPVTSAEAALDRFRTACDAEIKTAISPEKMARINGLRGAPSLFIQRMKPQNFAELREPAHLTEALRLDLFGSRRAVVDSTNDTWVLTYDFMKGLVAYVDAVSGEVLCVAFIPEG
jgi:hypothetical protein